MNLAEVKVNQEAVVTAVMGKNAIANRLMEMGIVPGVSVRVIKAAPFGDPIEVRLLGYNLALRRNEAAMISVAKV